MAHSFLQSIRHFKKTILLIVVVAVASILLTTFVAVLLSRTQNLTIPSVGTIYVVGVEIYGGDMKTTDGQQYIDWGTIRPGVSINRSFYIRSNSTVDIKLNLSDMNWNPHGLSGNITLSWDYNGTTISSDEAIYVTLTLSASTDDAFVSYLMSNDIQEFSFDIHIGSTRV
ncbi:hypothetical protein HXY33_01635 [Candidatus Bathyarchaeota archaeon]|nr:hypothetical protein [Candidatus Bathyarchaeota archaeon]